MRHNIKWNKIVHTVTSVTSSFLNLVFAVNGENLLPIDLIDLFSPWLTELDQVVQHLKEAEGVLLASVE